METVPANVPEPSEMEFRRLLNQEGERAIAEDFRIYLPGYDHPGYDTERVLQFARNHAYLKAIINLSSKFKQRYVRKLITIDFIGRSLKGEITRPRTKATVYSDVVKKNLFDIAITRRILQRNLEDPALVTEWDDLDYRIRDYMVIEGSRGNKRYTEVEMQTAIAALLVYGNQWQRMNNRELYEILKAKGFHMSPSHLKAWNRKYNYNEIDKRNGRTEFANRILPRLKFTPPEHACDEWEIDAFRINMPYSFHNEVNRRQYDFLTCCVVTDSYSGYPVGFNIGQTENHELAIGALRAAVDLTGLLPRKIVGDRSNAYKHDAFKAIVKELARLGCTFKKSPPNSPRSKSRIERIIGEVQRFMRHIPGNFGLGMTTKHPDSRLAPEHQYEAWRVGNVATKGEVYAKATLAIRHFANHKAYGLKNSPKELFEASEKPSAIQVSKERAVYLFWPQKEIKVQHSQIEFTVNKVCYTFTIDQVEQWKTLTGKTVSVRYNPRDLSKVYMFEGYDVIGTASRDIAIDKSIVEGVELSDVPAEELAFYEQRREQIKLFTRLHRENRRMAEELVRNELGEDAVSVNWLSSDKERVYKVQNEVEIAYYNERFGVVPEIEITGRHVNQKERRIEQTGSLKPVPEPEGNDLEQDYSRWDTVKK